MSQPSTWGVPRSGPATPTVMAERMDDSLDALLSTNSGTTAPSYAVKGTTWADTSVAGTITVKIYDGTDWVSFLSVNESTNTVKIINLSNGAADTDSATFGQLKQLASRPNILINGDFQLNQRSFAGGALSAGNFGFDRWKAATGGANVTISGFTVSLVSGELEQVIEPSLWGYASFASQAVTVSVDTPSQDLTVTFGSQSGTITAGAGRRSVTLTLGAGDTGNLSFKIKRASSSGVTFGYVKLEVGSNSTGWVARTSSEELMLANRYFQKSGWYFEGPVTSGQDYATVTTIMPMRTAEPTLTATLVSDNNFATTPVANGTTSGVLVWRRRRADGTGAGFFNDTFTAESEL